MNDDRRDTGDIADVAAAALIQDEHAPPQLRADEPAPMTLADTVAEIAAASGGRVGFVSVARDDLSAAASAAGVPGDDPWLLRYVFEETLDGRYAPLGDGVGQALVRAPRRFTEYARDVAATGAWQR